GNVTEQKVIMLFIVLTSIVLVGVAFTVIRFEPRKQVRPVSRLYLDVCAELARRGLPRQRGETPSAYCGRVTTAYPDLAQAMTALTELFVEINYVRDDGGEEDAKSALKDLKQRATRLRKQLRGLSFQS
ncbi:MAG: DUF4129 domain-containing protein, partial [Gammaproteobacteria bacterium]